MIKAYRLHSVKYAADDFTGAAKYGGRWNKPGTAALYTAASRSLAVLEILVHYSVLPQDFQMTEVRIPDRSGIFQAGVVRVWEPPRDVLPDRWWERPSFTASVGDVLLENTAVLAVPSAVIHEEMNYVLNPADPEFALIEFGPSEPFHFDHRLK